MFNIDFNMILNLILPVKRVILQIFQLKLLIYYNNNVNNVNISNINYK